MKWSRIILIIQAVLIVLLLFALLKNENEQKSKFEVSVEICQRAKIQHVVWDAAIEVHHGNLSVAHEQLESDKERVIRNFTAKGLSKSEISFHPVVVQQLDNDFYKLVLGVQIVSKDVVRVQKIIAESSDLLKFKVNFSSNQPRYELANFAVWLNLAIWNLVQSGKVILESENKILENKNLALDEMRIEPVYYNNYSLCNNDLKSFSDSISVSIRASLVFVAR